MFLIEEDIDSLTGCITDYINFCVDNTVPTRTVQCFSNSKRWINPDIKALLKEKRRVCRSGNEELKAVQKELRRKISEGKNSYRRKMENQLQQRNISGVWKSLKTISVQRTPASQAVGDQMWVNDMNLFFNRFDQTPTPPPTQPSLLPPHHFFHPGIGVDDAIIFLLDRSLSYLERPGSTVRIVFFWCFQHYTACTPGEQAGAGRGEPTPHILDPGLPH